MKSVLVTGVAGFIGSHVAQKFLSEGFKVFGVDDLSSGKFENIPKGVEFIKEDLSKKEVISKLPLKCDKILHLAGQSSGEISFDDPISDLEKNAVSTLNLIQYGIKSKAERIVYASSMSVYGSVDDKPIGEAQVCRPLSCYGVGKHAAEAYLGIYQKQVPSVILRMFNVYGPGQDMSNLRQGMVSVFLSQALERGSIEVKGSVDRFRDFIFVEDVVEAWFQSALRDEALGKTINVGTGVRTSVHSLLERLCSLVDGAGYFVNGSTPGDQSGIFSDNSEMKRTLGISEFTSLETGLEKFIRWARSSQKDGL